MNVRRFLAIGAVASAALAAPAPAHRLDEYLHATTIAIEPGELALRISLTPGVSVAPAVLAQIDGDGDGTLSPAEQRRYARRAGDALRLTIDGAMVAPRLRSWAFAAPAAFRGGIGDVTLLLAAPIGPGASHRIVLDHPHPDDRAVYLVNTLVPEDRRTRIVGQQRSVDQAHYQLDIAIDAAARGTPPPRRSAPAASRRDAAPVVATFFARGVRHILTGYDHLLFVAALALGATGLWDLLKVVTAFTIAHSLTLTLAALQLLHVPGALVEPVIAASIVAVAAQNLLRPARPQGGLPLLLAFLFGLFHGLGFAGGLAEAMHAMPDRLLLPAIAGFSLGAEAGNQMVLLPVFAASRALSARVVDPSGRAAQRVRQVGSAVIAGAGVACLIAALAP